MDNNVCAWKGVVSSERAFSFFSPFHMFLNLDEDKQLDILFPPSARI